MLLNLQRCPWHQRCSELRYIKILGGNTDMATIWFVNEAEVQHGPSAADKPLDWCVSELGLRPENWVTDLATTNLTLGEKTNPEPCHRGSRFVLVQIGDEDLAGSDGWKTGFHLLDMEAATARNLLER